MVKNFFKLVTAVHLLLIKDNKILLLRRFNTGYEDGNYSVIAGHVDGDKTVTSEMIREAKEEANIDIYPKDLKIVHVMHRKSKEERIDFFFTADKWRGEIKIMEPHKCDDLRWFNMDNLPPNIVPYVKTAIDNFRNNIFFSEFGWNS